MTSHYDPDRHHRRSIRLRGWDYARAGAYFITVCTTQRQHLFGEVVAGEMQFNALGRLVASVWQRLVQQMPRVDLDAFQVMPNHVHAIFRIRDLEPSERVEEARPSRPSRHLAGPESGELGAIVGNLEAVCTRRINRMRRSPGAPAWQRNYWEHIIRDEGEYARIRDYILTNPAHWADDRLYEPDPT
jgi:putative transposase